MKAQVSMFVIIAILIVAGVGAVIFINSQIQSAKFRSEDIVINALPEKLRPAEKAFIGCLKDVASVGANALGMQAGYIELPDREEGSDFMPFSSQFSFEGANIPYWFYVSGNNLQKMQIPSIESMQTQLNNYVKENAVSCFIPSFITAGYEVSRGDAINVESRIKDSSVDISVDWPLTISLNETSATAKVHSFSLPIALGKTYALANEIMDDENASFFLENYGIDVIALYAPTSGFDISCSPRTWTVNSVENTVKEALEGNTAFIKLKGDYYTLAKKENKYFVTNTESKGMNVNFMTNRYWPFKFEVYPSENGIMSAQPIGKQEITPSGILGACFMSYHFTYDAAYPVLVQVYDSKTGFMFQYPVVVSIVRNKPRTAETISIPQYDSEICGNKLQLITVSTYDGNGNPIEADIKFKCINTVCDIGKTKIEEENSVLEAYFPQCANGFILASAEGFEQTKYQISTNTASSALIFMQKIYPLDLSFNVDKESTVFLTAKSKTSDYSTTVLWPEYSQIELASGTYEIKAWAMKKGSFTLPGTKTESCIKVPAAGIAGLFGQQTEQCTTIEVPSITLTEVPYGGINLEYTVSEQDLESASKIKFSLNTYDVPSNQEQIQKVYEFIDSSGAQEPILE